MAIAREPSLLRSRNDDNNFVRASSSARALPGLESPVENPPIPETWIPSTSSSSSDRVPIRRMLDDFVRQGWTDDRILNYVTNSLMEYVMQVGMRRSDLLWLRNRQDSALKGVAVSKRPAYRDGIVRAIGRSITPWDATAPRNGTNNLELIKLEITEIPLELFTRAFIDYVFILDLQFNQISMIPPEIGLLTNLSTLRLGYNALEYVCPEMGRLRSLKSLSLNNNLLQVIPAELAQLKLEVLFLESNRLEYLPTALARLTSVTSFKVQNNPELKSPPKHIVDKGKKAIFSYLRNLDVGDQCGFLDLHEMELKVFPPDAISTEILSRLRHGSTLTGLDLKSNQISNIPSIIKFLGSHYSVHAKLSQLTYLSLEDNQLKKVPEVFAKLSRLTSLNLERNPALTHLPVELGDLTALTELRLSLHPLGRNLDGSTRINMEKVQFASPPIEILEQGDKRAMYDDVSGNILEPGSANVVIRYLRMINDAKSTGKLFLSHVGLREYPPEVHCASDGLHSPPKDAIEAKLQKDRLESTFTEPVKLLADLRYIFLERNSIPKIPDTLGAFTSLIGLSVDHNALDSLPPNLGSLGNLLRLSASYNKITKLPGSIGQCQKLKQLMLNNNRLSTLPDSIGACKQLEVALLSNNRIQNLPDSIGANTSLLSLDLENNLLSHLPNDICDLNKLEHLRVGKNRLVSLPSSIGRCCRLGELALDGNFLTEIPTSVGLITTLSMLGLDDIPKLSFPPREVCNLGIQGIRIFLNRFQKAQSDYCLRIPHLRLGIFPQKTWEMTEIVNLDLSHNDIRVIPEEIRCLSQLEVLWLHFNRICIVPGAIGDLSALRSLHLNNNRIKGLPQTIAQLDRLSELCLHANKFSILPLEIGALENLKILTTAENPLIEPPEDIVHATDGDKMAFNYLRAIFDSLSCEVLTLQGFGLRAVPVAVLRIVGLQSIVLDHNRIESLPSDCYLLTNLTLLSLAYNEISRLSTTFGFLTKLLVLHLQKNVLQKFDEKILQLTNLRDLNLGWNKIPTIPERIYNLSQLASFSIAYNPVDKLPSTVAFLTSLTELHFDGTNIRSIPMSIASLTRLRSLSIDTKMIIQPRPEITKGGLQTIMHYISSFNKFYSQSIADISGYGLLEFPHEFSTFRHLQTGQILGHCLTTLDLSRNRISLLAESFADMSMLTSLDLSYNAFNRLPGAVCWLTGLRKLSLEGNYHLRRLPVEMGNLAALKELLLSPSRFLAPPQEILNKLEPNSHVECNLGVIEYLQLLGKARSTGRLNLTRLGLRKFPPEIISAISVFWDYMEIRGTFLTGRGQLEMLEEVHLDHNNIQVLPATIGQLTRVRVFNLECNQIKVVPSSIANMRMMHTLNLAQNHLILFHPIICELTSITKLQLQQNELSTLPDSFCAMFNLREVSFTKNNLTELPLALPKLTNLRNLLVSENNLKTDPSNWGVPGISHEIGYMTNLIEIDIEFNEAIEVPPRDLWKGSSAKIFEFLRRVYEAKSSHELHLHDMGLRLVPEVLFLMQDLITLSLSRNTLRTISSKIRNMTNLTMLDLDQNDLVILPEEATYMSALKELHCSLNQIKGLPETCHRWICCERIIATDNYIHRLPEGICEMPNLTELDLERNKLRYLPEAFILCTNLTRLRFDSQDMVKASPAKDLPAGIRNCEIPAEIAIRGVDEIIQHFFKMHAAWSTCRLDLSGYGLRYVMEDVCYLTVLKYLNLAHSRLKFLPESMSHLVNLKTIILDENFLLEHFHPSLHVLTDLKKISISAGIADSWNYPAIQMKYPPTIVARNPDIMRMYLKELYECVGRKYMEYGEEKWATTFRLDYRFVPHEVMLDPVTAADVDSDAKRAFTHFPPEIFERGLTNLTWLQLPGGRITSEMVAEHVPMLTDLRKLVLIDQEIKYIPEEISSCTQMQVLCFTGNHITEIPDFIFRMVSLRKLILIENEISVIPSGIGQLTNLTDLVLTYNKLTVLPKELGNLFALDYLVLDENKIRQIPDAIQHMTSLIEFSFNDNNITRFPVSLGALTQLEILEYGKNPPILLPPRQVLQCEVKVVVDFMKRIWDCQQTQRLNMRKFQLLHDALMEIVKEICHCCTDLDLSKNCLNSLPANLKTITALTKLDLSENSLKSLNLLPEFEVQARPQPEKKEAVNLTLRQFFQELELPQLYDIVTSEYGLRKMNQLKEFVLDETKMSGLGLSDLERVRFADAALSLNLEEAHAQDKLEVKAQEVEEDDDDEDQDEVKKEEPENEGKQEAEIDEEEALRLIEDKNAGAMKIDLETFKNMAYAVKINFYKALVGVKAKIAERKRRKELQAFDKRVALRANGYKAKLRRLEEGGVPRTKKKKQVNLSDLLMTEEEKAEVEAAKRVAKAKALADREKLLGGNVDEINLEVGMGDGLVKRSIVSVACFTCLTELRARKNGLEHLPEDVGLLSNLKILDISRNDVRWLPPSFSNLVNLTLADLRYNLIFEVTPGISNCSSLTNLRLDHNKTYDMPAEMLSLTKLSILSLESNEFEVLPEWWQDFTQIRTLNIASNGVRKFANTFITMGEQLVELRCPDNNLTQVNYFFSRFVNLKILDMSHNPIENLPGVMGACSSLEELYVNDCNLAKMDIRIALCQNLRIFEFEGNPNMEYPPREVQAKLAIGVLKYFRQILDCPRSNMMLLDGFDLAEVDQLVLSYHNCTWLDLSKNNLIAIPSEIKQMQKIELLNLSYNRLGCIPRIVNFLPTICDLAIDKNEIEQIEPSIMLLTRLTRLSLASNRISRFHPSIFKLTSLSFLNLTDNRLYKIPSQMAVLSNLVSLGLGSNVIEEIPNDIQALRQLRQLVLFGNKLKSLPPVLSRLTGLEVLTLSQNFLVEFPPLLATSLTNLKELWLTHNLISNIPREFGRLTNLEQLWLQDNKLIAIPQEIGDLTKLKVLTLTGNRIREIPQHVKSLKIVQGADQEAGEEFWQDKEVDSFSVDEAEADLDAMEHSTLAATNRSMAALSQASTVRLNQSGGTGTAHTKGSAG